MVIQENANPKSNNKSAVLIVLGIFGVSALVICICSVATISMLSNSDSWFSTTVLEVQNTVLTDICESRDSITETQAQEWFTTEYLAYNSLMDIQDDIDMMFPENYECDEIFADNVIDLLKNGDSSSVSYSNGSTTGELTYSVSGDHIHVKSVKINDQWKISSVFSDLETNYY